MVNVKWHAKQKNWVYRKYSYSDVLYSVYSGTSNSGPSEIGAQYNRLLYKGHRARSQKFVS